MVPLSYSFLLSKSDDHRTISQKREDGDKTVYILFLITKSQNRREDHILEWRSISTGLPSRASWFFKALCITAVEMPWSLQWPLSPYLTVQFSEVPEMIAMMNSGREWGHLRGAHTIFKHFLIQECKQLPHTLYTERRNLDTWGHVSLRKATEMGVFSAMCVWKLRPNPLSVIMCLLKSKWVVEKAKKQNEQIKV